MKKALYLMAFLLLFICGQVGMAQAQAALEDGWYYLQDLNGQYMGLQQDASTGGNVFVVVNGAECKPRWMFYLENVDEEHGKITLKSISSGLYITETNIKADGGMQVMAMRNQEAGGVWQLRKQDDRYVLFSASSTEEEKQFLRFSRYNVYTSSEYNVGKNNLWTFIKTELPNEYKH